VKRKLSSKMIARLKSAKFFAGRMQDSLSCWRVEQDGFKYTEEQNKKMHEASRLYWQAKKLVDEVYAEMIGKQIVDEL
jgi:hypothetical protein